MSSYGGEIENFGVSSVCLFFFFFNKGTSPIGLGIHPIVCVFSGSVMSDSFAIPWTVAYQVPPL